jgi:hypothetical protein
LEHEWVNNSKSTEKVELSDTILGRMRNFRKTKRLKKAALTYIASRCGREEVSEARQAFLRLDKNKDGYLALQELHDGLQST